MSSSNLSDQQIAELISELSGAQDPEIDIIPPRHWAMDGQSSR